MSVPRTKGKQRRDGHYLDVELVEVFKIGTAGRWSEFWSMADDQSQVDAFWSGIARDDEEANTRD